MIGQTRNDGSLRHLLTLEGLPAGLLVQLLDRAQDYATRATTREERTSKLGGITVANLFTEPSTRTRASFELAAVRLGAEVINLEVQLSSRVKGESMLDTIYTLEAMGVDVFVIRDAEAGTLTEVASHVAPRTSVLSAGEAHVSHPTQGLLDALTIRQHKGGIAGLKVAIVGDIRHSRVARSDFHVLKTLGVAELRLICPPELTPAADEFPGCTRFTSLEDGLPGVDVVIMLRLQKERIARIALPSGTEYFARYGLNSTRLALAHPQAIVMHPQPMNRGIEIDSAVADGPQSVIRRQVTNGVAVRMAVLDQVASPLLASRAAP